MMLVCKSFEANNSRSCQYQDSLYEAPQSAPWSLIQHAAAFEMQKAAAK